MLSLQPPPNASIGFPFELERDSEPGTTQQEAQTLFEEQVVDVDVPQLWPPTVQHQVQFN